MQVELIASPERGFELASVAAKTCTSAEIPNISSVDGTKALQMAMDSGHDSVLEHCVYTFAVSGISRVTTHQLVRHRIASYSQQSQRYVKSQHLHTSDIVMPPAIERAISEHKDLGEDIVDMINGIIYAYNDLYSMCTLVGVKAEDIRYFKPHGAKTNIIVTMNARELKKFFELRCCNRAQWEIRELANKMLELCKETDFQIFKDFGTDCEHCRETKPCGKRDKSNKDRV